MRWAFYFSLAALAASISASASGEVFERDWKTPGDGLLTYDDVNRREWLDLTETQLFRFPGDTLEERYQVVLKETMAGGEFIGFLPATRNDVFALAKSAGIDTTTTQFDVNQAASNSLIGLLGDPIPGSAQANKWAAGFLGDGDLSMSLAIEFVPTGRSDSSAGITSTNFLESGNGIWLYRPIPEPSALMLFSMGIATLNLRFQRSRSVFMNPNAQSYQRKDLKHVQMAPQFLATQSIIQQSEEPPLPTPFIKFGTARRPVDVDSDGGFSHRGRRIR